MLHPSRDKREDKHCSGERGAAAISESRKGRELEKNALDIVDGMDKETTMTAVGHGMVHRYLDEIHKWCPMPPSK